MSTSGTNKNEHPREIAPRLKTTCCHYVYVHATSKDKKMETDSCYCNYILNVLK